MDSEIISAKTSRSVKDSANNDNHALDHHKMQEMHRKVKEIVESMRKSEMEVFRDIRCSYSYHRNYESSFPARDFNLKSITGWKKKLIIAAILFALLLVVILIALFQFRN